MKILMKKTLLATAVLATAGLSQADTILGVYAGAGVWLGQPSGFAQSGSDRVDLESDLNMDDDTGLFLYAALEHPIPALPNIRLAHTSLETTGESEITREISFAGQTFDVSDDVKSAVDLTMTDATFYYEILDNWVSADIGITARLFDLKVDVESATDPANNASEEADAVLPMLYAKAQFDLPFTGTYFGLEGNALSFDDNKLSDFSAKLGYEGTLGFGLEAGYRVLNLEIDDQDDITADIDVDGAYAAVTFHF